MHTRFDLEIKHFIFYCQYCRFVLFLIADAGKNTEHHRSSAEDRRRRTTTSCIFSVLCCESSPVFHIKVSKSLYAVTNNAHRKASASVALINHGRLQHMCTDTCHLTVMTWKLKLHYRSCKAPLIHNFKVTIRD